MKFPSGLISETLGEVASDLTLGFFRRRAINAVGRAIKEKAFEGTCGTVDHWLERRYAIQFNKIAPAFRVTLIRSTYRERDLALENESGPASKHDAMDNAVRRVAEVAAYIILGETDFIRRHGTGGRELASLITRNIEEGGSNWQRERKPNMEYVVFYDAHYRRMANMDLPASLTKWVNPMK